jgi:DNA repair exonuclease SbcCD ATPase subunit
MKETPPLKIVKLESENFKRLRAVSITPSGNMITISGRNEQGKSSVLDSIWAALAGAEAMKDTPQPIRKGEKAARVRVDLGDIVVNRAWTDKGTYLKVENSEGMEYKSPQALLDRFIGKLSFDPLAFSNMKPREQRETLLGLVKIDLDLDEWATAREQTYDTRTLANRRAKEVQAQIAGLPDMPPGTPAEEMSTADVLKEQAAAQAVKAHNDEKRRESEALTKEADRIKGIVIEKANYIESLETQLREAKARLADYNKKQQQAVTAAVAFKKGVAKLVDPDLSIYADKIAQVEATNRMVRVHKQRQELQKSLRIHQGVIETTNERLESLDAKKTAALAAAAFPIDGLAFDDEGVTYRGIPFSQCSAAERLRVSLAMAMALNPKIRVLRITDGSLLDHNNLQVIREMVEAQDYQLWIERVTDNGAVGVVIEDGMVRGAE